MEEWNEYVTEQTVLLRHPNMTATIRRFFADAGSNAVRAFASPETGFDSYFFVEMLSETAGRYFKLITTCDVIARRYQNADQVQQFVVKDVPVTDLDDQYFQRIGIGSMDQLVRPHLRDFERFEKQRLKNEWATGAFTGKPGTVAATAIDIANSESES